MEVGETYLFKHKDSTITKGEILFIAKTAVQIEWETTGKHWLAIGKFQTDGPYADLQIEILEKL